MGFTMLGKHPIYMWHVLNLIHLKDSLQSLENIAINKYES